MLRVTGLTRHGVLQFFHPDTVKDFDLDKEAYRKIHESVKKRYYIPDKLRSEFITMLNKIFKEGNPAVANSAVFVGARLNLVKRRNGDDIEWKWT